LHQVPTRQSPSRQRPITNQSVAAVNNVADVGSIVPGGHTYSRPGSMTLKPAFPPSIAVDAGPIQPIRQISIADPAIGKDCRGHVHAICDMQSPRGHKLVRGPSRGRTIQASGGPSVGNIRRSASHGDRL
jgi:hypothetical protein